MITKEELEARGWSFDSYYFTKGDIWKDNGGGASLQILKDNKILIMTTDEGWTKDGPEISIKFKGLCPDILTFDLICSLINIKC